MDTFGVGASSFQSPRSLVLCFFCLYFFSFKYFLITSLHLSFGLPIFLCPPTYISHVLITNLLQSFSPHGLTMSVSLLSFPRLCLPHLPFLIFLHSRSSQSSLFSSSISTFSFLFFLTSFLQPFSGGDGTNQSTAE